MKEKKELSREEKLKQLEKLNADFNKKFGENTIDFIENIDINVECFSTGLMTLDLAINGGKGLPKGRIIEVFGNESAGKTALCNHLGGVVQKNGGIVIFVDFERSFDPFYASTMGLDVENPKKFIYARPTSVEEMFKILHEYLPLVDLVIVDSVAAMATMVEKNNDVGDVTIASLPRVLSVELRRILNVIENSNATIIFINQVRDNISLTGYGGGGQTTPGGKALKFYASVRIDLRKIKEIKKGEESIGNLVRAKIVKNKVGSPNKVVEVELLFDKGFSAEGLIIDAALQLGIIERAGAWFKMNGENIAMGREKLRERLETEEDFRKLIENKIRGIEDIEEKIVKKESAVSEEDMKERYGEESLMPVMETD